jgi:acid stress chaperone HdeB
MIIRCTTGHAAGKLPGLYRRDGRRVDEFLDRHPEMAGAAFVNRFCSRSEVILQREMMMKTTAALVIAAGLMLSSTPSHAVVLDLSTMSCKQFLEGGDDTIKMVLTWMDGWYKGDSDEAIIDTDVFVENAKKFGSFCGKNPNISIVNAAEKILGN